MSDRTVAPTVLFIDQAGLSGAAWSTDLFESDVNSTTYSVHRWKHRAQRHLKFERWWGRLLDSLKPDFVGYEQPNVGHKAGKAGKFGARLSHGALMALIGYAAIVEKECTARLIPFAPFIGSTLQAAALGGGTLSTAAIKIAYDQLIREGKSPEEAKRGARKHALMLAARAEGWQVRDDNEADALFGLRFVCRGIQKGDIKW